MKRVSSPAWVLLKPNILSSVDQRPFDGRTYLLGTPSGIFCGYWREPVIGRSHWEFEDTHTGPLPENVFWRELPNKNETGFISGRNINSRTVEMVRGHLPTSSYSFVVGVRSKKPRWLEATYISDTEGWQPVNKDIPIISETRVKACCLILKTPKLIEATLPDPGIQFWS